MEQKWNQIFLLLTGKGYPEEMDKVQRASLKKYSMKFTVKDGELFYQNRRAIKTPNEAWKLFQEFHAAPMGGHTGIIKTRQAICSRFYWHGMTVQIDNWVSECDKCQREGKPLCSVVPLQSIKVSAVWELLGIDLTGPFPKTADGYQYIFTATDYFSKWVEAFPLKTKTAAEVGQRLCSIIYRHGCPKRILSDQGREFVNKLNDTLCSLLGIERSVTAAYHPQTNGLDEKTNHNIKRALMKLVNEQQNNWDTFLDATLFSLRSKVHTSTKHTPFQLLYGREAVFPSEVPVDFPLSIVLPDEDDINNFIKNREGEVDENAKSARENMSVAQDKQRLAYEKKTLKKYKGLQYTEGQEVLLFNMRKRGRKGGRLEADFTGPYAIKEVCGKNVYLGNREGTSLKKKICVNHIKPYKRSLAMDEHIAKKRPHLETATTRPSIIKFAPPPQHMHPRDACETKESVEEQVMAIWSGQRDGVEAAVACFKLYSSSFRTLEGSHWLADEVIDAYLHVLVDKEEKPVFHLSAVVGTSLFVRGHLRPLPKMKFPEEKCWVCPINTGGHWVLVLVWMEEQVLILIDPLGNEAMYRTNVLKNWRKFLRQADRDGSPWTVSVLKHKAQIDTSSCGILILKFAEAWLLQGHLDAVTTDRKYITAARLEVACTLLQQGGKDDYCIVCCFHFGEVEKVQCCMCSSFVHLDCTDGGDEIKCSKCSR